MDNNVHADNNATRPGSAHRRLTQSWRASGKVARPCHPASPQARHPEDYADEPTAANLSVSGNAQALNRSPDFAFTTAAGPDDTVR